MFRPVRVGIAAVVLAAAFASASFAAVPTKGAVYEGTLHASGLSALTKQVRLNVAASGKSGRVTWKCGVDRGQSTLQFPIKPDGTFKAYSNTGSLTVWSFVGKFVTKQRARAALSLKATCDGKGGTVNLTLKA